MATGKTADWRIGTFGFLVACVFWGLNLPLVAKLLEHFDPFWLTPNRQAVSIVTLAVWVTATLGVSRLRSPIPWSRVLVMSAWVAGFLVLYNLGLKYSTPITAAATAAGSPVYVAVVARVMLGAKLERGFWTATALTVLGAGIAIAGRADAGSAAVAFQGGELLIVVATCCWTVYSLLSQRWFPADTPQLQRTWLTTVASLPLLLGAWAVAWGVGAVGAPNLHPPPIALGWLAIAGIFCTAVSVVAWNTGVARLGIQTGGMWQNTVPVWAVLIATVFFGMHPTGQQILGGLIVLGGVLWMQWRKLREASAAAAGTAAAR